MVMCEKLKVEAGAAMYYNMIEIVNEFSISEFNQ